MSADLPYMSSVGNVPLILEKMRSAGTPPKFTVEFLKSTLGFTASQDRAFPRVLKQLNFLSSDGVPLPRYNEFKSATSGGRALAAGLQDGWAPLFMADQQVNAKSASEIKEICKTVTGQGDSVAEKMASLFRTLASKADWSGDLLSATDQVVGKSVDPPPKDVEGDDRPPDRPGFSLHHDVHVHLPPTSDVSVYRAIFRALREELM